MKNILILLFSFLTVTVSAKVIEPILKGSLSGTVTDALTGKPLAGVSVYISDTRSGTNSDANGNYTLNNISEGLHLIEYSSIGYGTIAVQVMVKGETKNDVALNATVIENNAVIVTGVSGASQLKKIPFQVDVLRKADLQQTSATNIIDAIGKKAGVSAIGTGPAISKPVIRGLGYNRVLVMNDGVRQEGQQWGDEHGIEIDEASVNKIEILKGPASLVYGSDAMAGVVNIITNVPVATNTIKANVSSNYQTNSRLRSISGNVAGNKNGFNWNVYGTKRAAADYKNKFDGRVFNSKFEGKNAGGYVGYNGSWGFSHLLVSNFDLTPGLIEGDRNDAGDFIKALPGGDEVAATEADFKTVKAFVPFQHIRHFKVAIDNNLILGNKNITFNVGFQRNKREEFGNADNINEQGLFFDLKTMTYSAQLHFQEKGGWKPSIGFNGMSQTNTNRGIEQLIPDYQLNDAGIFVFTKKDWDKLTFSGGARFDSRNITTKNLLDEDGNNKGDAFKKDFSNFSASTGIAYQIDKAVNLKLNIARAFRAPSIPELAGNGVHEGTIRYEYGDNNLKSETSTQADAGVEINSTHFSLNLAGYVNNFRNFIFYSKLASSAGGDSTVEVDGEQISAFKFAQRKALLAGMEATLDIHPHPLDWLHFQNTFSFVSGRFKEAIEGTKNLPFIPAPRLVTELRGDFKNAGKLFSNAYVKAEVDNTFKQNKAFTAFDTETATTGYTLLNAGIGADVKCRDGNTLFTLNFAANNITDEGYQNHLSRIKYAALNPVSGRMGVFNQGRNFSIKLNIPLSFSLK